MGTDWIYALIVHEIAEHHNPYLVLKLLRHHRKYLVFAIAVIIISFGTGMAVMRLIQAHASKKEIDEAMKIVSLAKKEGEY